MIYRNTIYIIALTNFFVKTQNYITKFQYNVISELNLWGPVCSVTTGLNTRAACVPWWRYQMEPFSSLLALCVGNSPVTGEFPEQRPVTRSFDVFYLRLDKRLSKQSWSWWSETPSRRVLRHCNDFSAEWVSAVLDTWLILYCIDKTFQRDYIISFTSKLHH